MTLYFIGGGKMAGAIIKGLLRQGSYVAEDIVVVDPVVSSEDLGAVGLPSLALHKTAEGLEVGSDDVVLLAVKPQVMGDVLSALPKSFGDGLVITIAAGISIDFIVGGLGGGNIRVVRVMPNTPAAIGLGMSVFCLNSFCGDGDSDLVNSLFSAVGEVCEIVDEDLMHLVTAVSGSGPAYVFYFMECFVRGAVELGMDDDLAWRLVRGVFGGSLGLVDGLGLDGVVQLRGDVTSSGGTTEAAIGGMEDLGEVIKKGLERAVARSREL